jgi:hypothetical protein
MPLYVDSLHFDGSCKDRQEIEAEAVTHRNRCHEIWNHPKQVLLEAALCGICRNQQDQREKMEAFSVI